MLTSLYHLLILSPTCPQVAGLELSSVVCWQGDISAKVNSCSKPPIWLDTRSMSSLSRFIAVTNAVKDDPAVLPWSCEEWPTSSSWHWGNTLDKLWVTECWIEEKHNVMLSIWHAQPSQISNGITFSFSVSANYHHSLDIYCTYQDVPLLGLESLLSKNEVIDEVKGL